MYGPPKPSVLITRTSTKTPSNFQKQPRSQSITLGKEDSPQSSDHLVARVQYSYTYTTYIQLSLGTSISCTFLHKRGTRTAPCAQTLNSYLQNPRGLKLQTTTCRSSSPCIWSPQTLVALLTVVAAEVCHKFQKTVKGITSSRIDPPGLSRPAAQTGRTRRCTASSCSPHGEQRIDSCQNFKSSVERNL